MTGGLLIAGRSVLVPGLTIIPPAPAGPHWCSLDPGDYRMRHTGWVRQVVLHTTKGDWPQPILPGAGVPGRARAVADFWRGDPTHSAAHLVIDLDGSVACLCDLAYVAAYHAEMSNDWSVGIELYQVAGGGIYQATLDAAARLVPAICDALGIPFQIHHAIYANEPLVRMETVVNGRRHQVGGPDVVGVIGHRDNTSNRGRGDPGDAVYDALIAAGAEPLDYTTGEDLRVGAARQTYLVQHGARIQIDGKVGPASLAAARRLGYLRWRDVPAAAVA